MNSLTKKPMLPGNCCSLIFALAILVGSVSAFSQPAGYRPVHDIAAFKKQFGLESAKVLSITSDFTQEKTLVALTETITSTGKFWFQRSNLVRLEYQKPFAYVMIMDGDKLIIRDHQKENRVNVKSNKLFQQVNRIMMDCVQGTILDSRDFSTKIFEDDKSFLLEMMPVPKALKEFFQTVVLIVDKRDYSVSSITLHEPQGDETRIAFEHKKLNEPIANTVFTP